MEVGSNGSFPPFNLGEKIFVGTFHCSVNEDLFLGGGQSKPKCRYVPQRVYIPTRWLQHKFYHWWHCNIRLEFFQPFHNKDMDWRNAIINIILTTMMWIETQCIRENARPTTKSSAVQGIFLAFFNNVFFFPFWPFLVIKLTTFFSYTTEYETTYKTECQTKYETKCEDTYK